MTQLSKELLQTLKKDRAFLEYAGWIMEKINSINTADGLAKLPREEAGDEGRMRDRLSQELHKLIDPVLLSTEKRKPTQEEIDEAGHHVGLS